MIDFIVVPKKFIPKEALADLLCEMGGSWAEGTSFGSFGEADHHFEVDWNSALPPTLSRDERRSLERRLGSALVNLISVHSRLDPAPGTPVGEFVATIIQRWGGFFEAD